MTLDTKDIPELQEELPSDGTLELIKLGNSLKFDVEYIQHCCIDGLEELEKLHRAVIVIIDQLMFLTDKEALQKAVFEFHETLGTVKENLVDGRQRCNVTVQYIKDQCFP